jgi:prepilin-type N-terminal cleavage/methylation domain-containing protein
MKLPISNFQFPIAKAETGAFTLMEIMIVVAIIGLIAAMGMPSMFKALQKDGMRKAVSDVQDVFFTARERAIISGQTVKAVFHIQDRRFEAEGGGGLNGQSGKVASGTLPDGISFGMFDIYHQDYAESEAAWIYFNPDGTCDDGVVIALVGRGEKRFITLDFATGVPQAMSEFR